MLIRASGVLAPQFQLLTLGSSCHYVAGDADCFYLFDPGLSVHAPMLVRRLNERGYSLRDCAGIILTHLHADRAGGVPYLRKHAPSAKLFVSAHGKMLLQKKAYIEAIYAEDRELSLKFPLGQEMKVLAGDEYAALFSPDKALSDAEHTALSAELHIRVLAFQGHTPESIAYLVEPHGFLIADEGLGYFRGRELPSPGFDHDIDTGIRSLERILQLDLHGLCLPVGGVVSAALQRKHLAQLLQCIADVRIESQKAISAGTSTDEIRIAIENSLYRVDGADPLLRYNLARSFEALWKQLERSTVSAAHSSADPS